MRGRGGQTCSNLVFPVSPAAMPEATKVLNYFRAMLDASK